MPIQEARSSIPRVLTEASTHLHNIKSYVFCKFSRNIFLSRDRRHDDVFFRAKGRLAS